MIKEWYQGFHKCTSNLATREFICELNDEPFDKTKSFLDIVYDILKDKPKPIEILYSGGSDSELILYCCRQLKIPHVAITMDIKVKNRSINTHDLYYAQKFCIANDIPHKIITFNADEFYANKKHFEYLVPYNIYLPHVASQFYLIEQCHSFPIIGGNWPWIQMHKENKVISPVRLDFSCYEEFYKSKGMTGIGNFLSYNLEITYYLCKKHIELYTDADDEASLKYKIYKEIMPNIEPRYKSFGWEMQIPNFSLAEQELKLRYRETRLLPTVKWGSVLQALLETSYTSNNKFK